MRLLKSSLAAFALTSLVAMPVALAQNALFLNHSILQSLTPQDFDIMVATLNKTLDGQPDGAASSWSSPATGASGTITPLRTTKDAARTCRVVETVTRARGNEGRGQWEYCRTGDAGRWSLR
jgi:surface antigen